MSLRRVRPAAIVAAAVLLAGCTSSAEPAREPTTPRTLEWQRLRLPGGVEPVTLAATEDHVVVGAVAAGRPRPRLLVGDSPHSLREVPLTPRSPYAFEARWLQVAVRGDRIEAVGGARGGAHANYRWSTWSGTTAGVAEQEQPFGVFGSYGAGDLAGIAYAGSSPVVLGAWQGERTGMDVATWTRSGARWTRAPSTGTPLASDPGHLADARVVASRSSDGLLLGGSVTRLAPGSVEVVPAVWTSPRAGGPWTRLDLPRPGAGGTSGVTGARCHGDRCVLTGVTDGRLTVWEVTGGTATVADGIPEIEVPENGTVPSPVIVGDDLVVIAPSGSTSVLLSRQGTTWTRSPGPDGTPTAVAALRDEVWVVAASARGAPTLWRARVA